jgi:RNA polymerase-binding transcription factor
MARRHSLSRLAKTLLARHAHMYRVLADEMAHLADFTTADSTGDSADRAFDADSDEMCSRLAELDARELSQMDRAATRVTQHAYGICEGGGHNCEKRIPLARLRALPYATLCINCERDLEKHRHWRNRRGTLGWGRVVDPQAGTQDQRINVSALERLLAEG